MNDYRSNNWFQESAANLTNDVLASKPSFGAYQNTSEKSFDEAFDELCESYSTHYNGMDIKKDLNTMLSDRTFMNEYKKDLIEPIAESFRNLVPNDPHIEDVIHNVEDLWDIKVNKYNESATLPQLLPMSTLEFPVLVKQYFGSVLKDIIDVETTKSPNITKHVRTTFLVDNNTGEEYEYPKCMFDGTWEKIFDAAKGHKIKEEPVTLTNGRLWKYDIITNLTDGVAGVDELSWQFKIIAVEVGGEVIPIPGNGITVEFSTNGTLVNGDLNFEYNGTKVEDTISGMVDYHNGTISLSVANGQVTGVVFSGYLSNANNLRNVSVREKRDLLRFTIEDGPRWNMPFSIEDIEDSAALLDINYYNRMIDEITRTQSMEEDMTVVKFLINEHDKFLNINNHSWDLEPISRTYKVDLDTNGKYIDPYKYISTATQFRIKAAIHQIAEITKLEGLSFIIVGNPMACQLISEFTNWKVESGTSVGGINVNNSYGYTTDLGANVRIVASNIYDAYTPDPQDETGKRELVVHIYGYPTDAEHISFKHLKYTSHLLTSQGQSAYQSPRAQGGGAYQIVTATSRFRTISIQSIAVDIVFLNSEIVYGPAPTRTTAKDIVGAPWTPIP